MGRDDFCGVERTSPLRFFLKNEQPLCLVDTLNQQTYIRLHCMHIGKQGVLLSRTPPGLNTQDQRNNYIIWWPVDCRYMSWTFMLWCRVEFLFTTAISCSLALHLESAAAIRGSLSAAHRVTNWRKLINVWCFCCTSQIRIYMWRR